MPHLEVLHIRTTPVLKDFKVLPSVEAMLNCLLSALVNKVIAKARDPDDPTKLRTVALGAPTYRDIMIGSSHAVSKLRDYFQLRIYRVHYRTTARGKRTSVLDMVAKGTCEDAAEFCDQLDLFRRYWLQ